MSRRETVALVAALLCIADTAYVDGECPFPEAVVGDALRIVEEADQTVSEFSNADH
jgi:hypothetical protein